MNPVTVLVRAMRALAHGEPAGGDVTVVLLVSAGLAAVFGPLAARAYGRQA
ncbi:hypothetical protein [Thalassiella azotivora]